MRHARGARNRCLRAAVLAALGLISPAWAQQTLWQHNSKTPGDWFDPANWTGGIPSAQTAAIINNEGTAVISGGSPTARYLGLGETIWGKAVGGTVRQTAGVNTIVILDIRSAGRYELAEGTLRISQRMSLAGSVDFVNGSSTLDIGPRVIANWSSGTIANARQATLSIGPESLLIVPAEFDAASTFRALNNQGLIHRAGTTLLINTDQTVRGVGAIIDPVEVRGTLAATPDGKLDLTGSLLVTGGLVDLGAGKFSSAYNAASGISSGKLIATEENYSAKARFVQTGGEHTVKSLQASSDSTYELSGGQLTADTATVGNFIHTGGTHSARGLLNVRTYDMGGQARLSAGRLLVSSAFRQSGGTSTLGMLTLGSESGNIPSTYELSGGQLTALREQFGDDNDGPDPSLFRQTGGIHAVSTMILGGSRRNTHTYELSQGQFHAGDLDIAYRYNYGSKGIFVQGGGTGTVDHLRIGKDGRFEFKGGSLSLGNDINVAGVFDLGGQEVNLSFGPASILDFGHGQLLNTQSASLHLGADSLLVVPPGFNPAASFRSFSNPGLTHVGGTPLVLAPNQRFSGSGILSDPVQVAGGSITIPAKGRLEFAGGLSMLPGGTVTAQGKLVIGGASTQTGGSIQADHFALAWDYTQRGGIVDTTFLSTDDNYGYGHSYGNYNLIDGELRSGDAHIAYIGYGHFIQDGGTHRVSGTMTVLGDNDYKGLGYQLNGGRLEAKRLIIGDQWGYGTLRQAGGDSIIDSLLIGEGARYSITAGALHVAEATLNGGTLSLLTPAADLRITRRLTVKPASRLQANPGAAVHLLAADFENHQTFAYRANDLRTLNLIFEANADRWSTLEVASQLRDTADPYLSNFALGTLTIGGETPGRVRLVDLFDNQPGPEALYVDHLVMTAGSILDLNGIPLHYRTASISPDAMILVPEPAATMLAMVIVFGLRRRRPAS